MRTYLLRLLDFRRLLGLRRPRFLDGLRRLRSRLRDRDRFLADFGLRALLLFLLSASGFSPSASSSTVMAAPVSCAGCGSAVVTSIGASSSSSIITGAAVPGMGSLAAGSERRLLIRFRPPPP